MRLLHLLPLPPVPPLPRLSIAQAQVWAAEPHCLGAYAAGGGVMTLSTISQRSKLLNENRIWVPNPEDQTVGILRRLCPGQQN